MNKSIIIGVSLLAFILGLGLMWFLLPDVLVQNHQNNTYNTFPISSTTSNQKPNTVDVVDPTIAIKTPLGNVLQVRNFLKDSETVVDPQNTGYYYLGNHYPFEVDENTIIEQPEYIILYIAETQFFNVALLKEPISTSRKNAEQYLLEHLGVSKEQLCQLDYMVSVPYTVNEFYTSQSLGFSFCQGSILF